MIELGNKPQKGDLLHAGNAQLVEALLKESKEGRIGLDINCKGTSKSNHGWTPLLLASYFGHKEVVQLLLEYGADVDIANDVGDTPLHRAAYTGRVEVVMLLLANDADVTIINAEGQRAKHIAKTTDIKELIEAAEQYECRKREVEFLAAARDGDTEKLQQMLKDGNGPSINCVDKFGNSALHCAAYRDRKEVAVLLFQNGINPKLTNAKGQTALMMCKSTSMRCVLDVRPIQTLLKEVCRFEGTLLKKARLRLKYVWVVLDRGVMSSFKTRADATTGSNRKGFKYLDDAKVMVRADDPREIRINFSDDTHHVFLVDPTDSQACHITKQKWLNALQEHISFSTYYTRKGSVNNDEELDDLMPLGSLQDALQTSQAHQQLLERQVAMVTSLVNNMSDERNHKGNANQVRQKLPQIVESSRDMCTSLHHCLTLFTQQEELRKLQLKQEMEKSRVLQDALHALATEHHELEKSVSEKRAPARYDTDDDEFYDCDEDEDSVELQVPEKETRTGSYGSLPDKDFYMADDNTLKSDKSEMDLSSIDANSKRDTDNALDNTTGDNATNAVQNPSAISQTTAKSADFYIGNGKMDNGHNKSVIIGNRRIKTWNCRTNLPVEMFSRNEFSVWSILKQCIGRELSKITMPVIFNEPLSFLQRITEYLEYATLLQYASHTDDPVQRLEYVSAFAASASASNWDRVGKPFNPLLGETYELTREDLGFKIVCEQVSHHPPISAFHVESPFYKFSGSIHPKLKFWGKTVECVPKGVITLQLLKYNETYTWSNINCSIHNIIVGKLWIEHHGVMEIQNHSNGMKSVLNFKQGGWFGKDLHKIEGFIYDKDKNKLKALYGKWVESLISCEVKEYENALQNAPTKHIPVPKLKLSRPRSNPSNSNNGSGEFKDCQQGESRLSLNDSDIDDDIPSIGSTFDLQIPGQSLLWQADPRPPSSEKYYSFTLFAMMLNELTSDIRQHLPHTDSRLRPDIRLLEDGNIDLAAEEKVRLEEKQRAARKERKRLKEEWTPRWFENRIHPQTGKEDWFFTDKYWDRNDDNLPDIF
ncbi:unnamed protein product [Owenia fusiformis]|uniref:Oxysterol-binding protein n=1 Tax=Owenia fusiformis TaxID=6347 RepID=A0A8S4MY45_OWEFU|nr:unnamed protein product [Owenia fusiformis]